MDNKEIGVLLATAVRLVLMVRKEVRDLLGHKVTPVTLGLLGLLEVLDFLVALEELDSLVGVALRASRVPWGLLAHKDPLVQREAGDLKVKLVRLDGLDSQEFRVVKDSRELLVCYLLTDLCLCFSVYSLTHRHRYRIVLRLGQRNRLSFSVLNLYVFLIFMFIVNNNLHQYIVTICNSVRGHGEKVKIREV